MKKLLGCFLMLGLSFQSLASTMVGSTENKAGIMNFLYQAHHTNDEYENPKCLQNHFTSSQFAIETSVSGKIVGVKGFIKYDSALLKSYYILNYIREDKQSNAIECLLKH